MIFISSQDVDNDPAKSLIERLRQEGFSVEHSPRNPLERNDSRWKNWYEEGLRSTLDKSEVFVSVIDGGWDSSSWMAEEAHQAMDAPGARPVPYAFFWNPLSIEIRAEGTFTYLRKELPKDLNEFVERMMKIENI